MRRSNRSGSAPPDILREQLQQFRTQILNSEGERDVSDSSSPDIKSNDSHKKKHKHKNGDRSGENGRVAVGSFFLLPGVQAHAQGISPKNRPKSPNSIPTISELPEINKKMTQDDNNVGKLLAPSSGNSAIQRSPSFRRKKAAAEKAPVECNIALLGSSGVGKTALAVRFVTRRYLHEYDRNLERTYERILEIDGENVIVRLWDTVNKEFESYTDSADAFIVVYSITSSESYNYATNTVRRMKSISGLPLNKHIPVMLLGNKMEMDHGRTVKIEPAEVFSSQVGCSFSETSAALDSNVENSIKSIVKQVQNGKTPAPTPTVVKRKQSTAMYLKKTFLSKVK